MTLTVEISDLTCNQHRFLQFYFFFVSLACPLGLKYKYQILNKREFPCISKCFEIYYKLKLLIFNALLNVLKWKETLLDMFDVLLFMNKFSVVCELFNPSLSAIQLYMYVANVMLNCSLKILTGSSNSVNFLDTVHC